MDLKSRRQSYLEAIDVDDVQSNEVVPTPKKNTTPNGNHISVKDCVFENKNTNNNLPKPAKETNGVIRQNGVHSHKDQNLGELEICRRPAQGQAGRRDASMEERDQRPYRLSAGGGILNLLAFVASLCATVTHHWASFNCKYFNLCFYLLFKILAQFYFLFSLVG